MNDPRRRENFCPAPFTQLQLNHLGNVSVCCFSNEHSVGTVPDESIESIWNNEKIQEWRREMVSGDLKICQKWIDQSECHKIHRHLISKVRDLSPVQSAPPIRLDLRLNGLCNLQCIMCSVWKVPDGPYDRSDFWTYGEKHVFPFLEEIELLGGEPMIQKDTYRLMEKIAAVNPNCKWRILTNCQYTLNEKIKSHLKSINVVEISMSLDAATAPTYEKIRVNGDFEKALKTVEDYCAFRDELSREGKKLTLTATMCVQPANWDEVPAFIEFCRRHAIQPSLQKLNGSTAFPLEEIPLPSLKNMSTFLRPILNNPETRLSVFGLYEEISQTIKYLTEDHVVFSLFWFEQMLSASRIAELCARLRPILAKYKIEILTAYLPFASRSIFKDDSFDMPSLILVLGNPGDESYKKITDDPEFQTALSDLAVTSIKANHILVRRARGENLSAHSGRICDIGLIQFSGSQRNQFSQYVSQVMPLLQKNSVSLEYVGVVKSGYESPTPATIDGKTQQIIVETVPDEQSLELHIKDLEYADLNRRFGELSPGFNIRFVSVREV